MPTRSQHSDDVGQFQSRQRLPDQTRSITIARVNRFLGLEACDRPGFLASLNPGDPPGGVALFVTAVVRRVVVGQAKPDVLTILGNRPAVPLLTTLAQTCSATRQNRIRLALAEIAPAIAMDAELVAMLKMACWSRTGADRNGSESLPAAGGSHVTAGP